MVRHSCQVQEATSRALEPVPDQADCEVLVAGGGDQIHVVRAEVSAPHHVQNLEPGQISFVQGEAAHKSFTVDGQQEAAMRTGGSGEPP